jgi:hypothetical protein
MTCVGGSVFLKFTDVLPAGGGTFTCSLGVIPTSYSPFSASWDFTGQSGGGCAHFFSPTTGFAGCAAIVGGAHFTVTA